MDPIRVLVIDDDKTIREVLSESLKDDGYIVSTAEDGVKGLEQLRKIRPQIVLLDIWMPGEIDGIEVLRRADTGGFPCNFIMMSGHGNIETAVKATKLGAWDFVEKPISYERISILIKNAVSFQEQLKERNILLNRLRQSIAIVGESEIIKKVKESIARLAGETHPVLIEGPSGTGKELFADNIHYLSERAAHPLIKINCLSLPNDLMVAEFFGFEKGAFPGAERVRRGKLDLANGGTLILEEIHALNKEAQIKLLGLLKSGAFTRQGGTHPVSVNIRIIGTTTQELKTSVQNGNFSEELFYRLSKVTLKAPSLKDRIEDIPSLINHFAEQISSVGKLSRKRFKSDAVERLKTYGWPGNVLELKNFVERTSILIPNDIVELEDLAAAGLIMEENDSSALLDGPASFRAARAEFERRFILKRLETNGGNVSKTAEEIGIERSHLHRKIKAYGIEL